MGINLMEYYFEIPIYRDLTKLDGWDDLDGNGVKYQVARAIFKIVTSHMPGQSKLGRKFDVLGAPNGIGQERIKVIEVETEAFEETQTIERSIVESNSMQKIIADLSTSFGDGVIFRIGGKATAEAAENIKSSFQENFQITNSSRSKKTIRYEFKDIVNQDCNERVCGAATYQQCRADLYLLKVDFLNIEYKRRWLGLRKKLVRYPFPKKTVKSSSNHPNVIHIGAPLVELRYWELLPQSSLIIKDSEYIQEVENDSEISVHPPRQDLRLRPYWPADSCPSLYQLSRVAFPFKWVNKPHRELSKEDLMQLELGEAEGTGWWYHYGPGRYSDNQQ